MDTAEKVGRTGVLCDNLFLLACSIGGAQVALADASLAGLTVLVAGARPPAAPWRARRAEAGSKLRPRGVRWRDDPEAHGRMIGEP
jgi:hypothetical protein